MPVGSSVVTATPQVSTLSVPRGTQVDPTGVPHSCLSSRSLEHGQLHLLLRRLSLVAGARYEAEATKPDQFTAPHDIGLTMAPGEFVSLVGPSDYGKSTTLRLLARLEQPIEGSVIVDFTQVTGPPSPYALAFQDVTLLPWRTAQDNAALGPGARGRVERDRCRVEAALWLVGLWDFTDSYPSVFSGGTAQRASLTRVLVSRLRFFLLDEPLGKLNTLTHPQLQDKILGPWKSQCSIAVLVTHDVNEALRLSDRVAVLSRRLARVVADIEVSEHDESSDEAHEPRWRIPSLLGQ